MPMCPAGFSVQEVVRFKEPVIQYLKGPFRRRSCFLPPVLLRSEDHIMQ